MLGDPSVTLEKINDALSSLEQMALLDDQEKISGDSSLFSPYCVSKCALHAYTRFVLPKMMSPGQQCYVFSPGWVETEMGG